MRYEVRFSPEARDDLKQLYVFIAERSGEARALRYVERIEAFCERLSAFPRRGSVRDDLAPGLRIIGFERRVTIAFHIDAAAVVLDRILYAGRTFGAAWTRSTA